MLSGGDMYVGIDVGGTKTLAVVGESPTKILGRATRPTPTDTTAEAVVLAMVDTGLEAIARARLDQADIKGVGVAAAGAIAREEGKVVWAPQIPCLHDVAIVEMFQHLWSIPVSIDNDANLAALAEHRLGAAQGHHNVVFITISTGIGGGIILDDSVYRGHLGFAGEIGHMSIDTHGPLGRSTIPGAWESLCSGSAIARIAQERIRLGGDSSLRKAHRNEDLDAPAVFAAARDGDHLAKSIIAEAVENLGTGLTNVVNILNPSILVIGGGLSNEWEAYITPAIARMRNQSFAGAGLKIPITPPILGADAGAIGAMIIASETTKFPEPDPTTR